MGSIGAPEILLVALIALLLFGAGRIADIGKGLGQGIKNFKQGIREANEDDDDDKKSDDAGPKKLKKAAKDDDVKDSDAKAKEA
jgi:sec-independent protein translocase protein TatA